LTNKNHKLVKELFESLNQQGYFTVSNELKQLVKTNIKAGWCNEDQCTDEIQSIYKETNKFIDPHTAVAIKVAKQYHKINSVPMLISSTAHFAKFPNTILNALDGKQFNSKINNNSINNSIEHMFKLLMQNPHDSSSIIHPNLLNLITLKPIHTTTIKANKIAVVNQIKQFLYKFEERNKL
jgi:threonine synthase